MEAPVLKTARRINAGSSTVPDRPHLEVPVWTPGALQFITTSAQTDQLSVKCPICVQHPAIPSKRSDLLVSVTSSRLDADRAVQNNRLHGDTGQDGRHPPPDGFRQVKANRDA